jgi:hypothetical protein
MEKERKWRIGIENEISLNFPILSYCMYPETSSKPLRKRELGFEFKSMFIENDLTMVFTRLCFRIFVAGTEEGKSINGIPF